MILHDFPRSAFRPEQQGFLKVEKHPTRMRKFHKFYWGYSRHSSIRAIRDKKQRDFKKPLINHSIDVAKGQLEL